MVPVIVVISNVPTTGDGASAVASAGTSAIIDSVGESAIDSSTGGIGSSSSS